MNVSIGPYVLLPGLLGENSKVWVFKGRHEATRRLVALKVQKPEAASQPTLVRRFRRETRALASLDHDHVVRVLDAGLDNGACWYAMPYEYGVDLDAAVRRLGPPPIDLACDLVRQAALGLQHIHEAGFVSRDVKPSNLLITPPRRRPGRLRPPPGWLDDWSQAVAGVVKVIDLSVGRRRPRADARPVSSETEAGVFIGTADYAAPELIDDARRANVRSDLYSLGCTFYFLLSGEVPYPGGDRHDKLRRHRSDEKPLPLPYLRPETPPEVLDVVRKLMSKRPGKRCRSAAEVAERLAALAPTGRSRLQVVW
jgi:serine/threonine protein kinase